jgi:hypothetical protein
MNLPFTADQFFGVLADYNRLFLWAVIGLWLASVAWIVATKRDPAGQARSLSYFLAALWAWNAMAYHAVLFTRINPAAWLFAAFFAVQAVLLFVSGRRGGLEYFSATGVLPRAGAALVLYALAYPFLSSVAAHHYPAAPTYGLPCPTVILTIGVLLTARSVPLALAIVPVLWAFVGGSAAFLLDVPTDYVLLASGVLMIFGLLARASRGVARRADYGGSLSRP